MASRRLWPDHCVQGTPGAALHPELDVDLAFLILRKGMHPGIDSYSAFVEADGKTTTGLAALLKARGVEAGVRLRSGDRFLRRLIPRSMRARAGLRDLRDRGRLPRRSTPTARSTTAWARMSAAGV